jgi:Polyketide cyclase / dehydrase and lipid transport
MEGRFLEGPHTPVNACIGFSGRKRSDEQRRGLEAAMTSFDNVVVIARPREEVFAFLADLENVPTWNPAIEVTWKTSSSAVGVGTTYRQVRAWPKRNEETIEVTVFEPPHRLMVEGQIGPFRAQVGYMLEVDAEAGVGTEATRLTNWVELEPPSIISALVVPMAASQIKTSVASNLETLKRILEDSLHTP